GRPGGLPPPLPRRNPPAGVPNYPGGPRRKGPPPGRGIAMATIPTPPVRHALGLPAGSVRALLGLAVLGLLWVMALKLPQKLPLSFVYLQSLMLVILAHYFAAHGKTV